MACGPITSWQIDWEIVTDFIFLGFKITADGDGSHEIKRWLLLRRKVMISLDSTLKSRDYFADKGLSSQNFGFFSSHAWMWELDYKQSWLLKNWCFWTVVLKTLKGPLDSKEIQPVHPKGNQFWIFIRTDAGAETPIFWPPDVKSWLIWKEPDAGKEWSWEEKGKEEDEIVGWQLYGHEFEKAPEVGNAQGSQVCCGAVCCKESDMTEFSQFRTELNW